MVTIIHKSELPQPDEVPPSLRAAAVAALGMRVREPRPVGFPLLFTSDMQLIEPAVAFLHEHLVQRAHTVETVRTYAEILVDWFDALEHNGILWGEADAVDLVAYRNRMLSTPSPRTHRPYSIRTINHRVRGVLRFYDWAVRHERLRSSPLTGRDTDFTVTRRYDGASRYRDPSSDRGIFLLRQFEALPRPLTGAQACELMARLVPPYDLMARWQLFTGLRVSELLRLSINDVSQHDSDFGPDASAQQRVINVMCKGRKSGYVLASSSLLDETHVYRCQHRRAWLNRAARRRTSAPNALFVNDRGTAAKKNTYQHILRAVGKDCGFPVTSHQLRATFACIVLARLEQLAAQGAAINPLLIVKILLHHERIETTDRYLRAVAVDTHSLTDILDSLIPETI